MDAFCGIGTTWFFYRKVCREYDIILGKRTAPGLLSLCVALLECLAHGLDLVRVTAGQSIGKLNDTVGSLVHTPVTVLGDICLRLCLGSRIYGEITGT